MYTDGSNLRGVSSIPNADPVELKLGSFILSHQFTFFVGQEEKPIVVHAAAIAATSQQLDALINGGMQESATRCVRIEDVKVDDFIRFCEYAYRGDYTTPPWEKVPPEPSSTFNKGQQNGDDDSWGVLMSKKKKGKKGKVVPVPEIYEPAPDVYDECPPAEPVPEPSYETAPISRTSLRARFNSRTYLEDGGPKAQIL